MCDGKCCPEAGWVCCQDYIYCATDLASCPKNVKQTEQLERLVKDQHCDGVICPGGCCSKPDYVCCPDGIYCASYPELCPPQPTNLFEVLLKSVKTNQKSFGNNLNKISKLTSRDCQGVHCGGGCCNEPGWICCPDDLYCALDQEFCP